MEMEMGQLKMENLIKIKIKENDNEQKRAYIIYIKD